MLPKSLPDLSELAPKLRDVLLGIMLTAGGLLICVILLPAFTSVGTGSTRVVVGMLNPTIVPPPTPTPTPALDVYFFVLPTERIKSDLTTYPAGQVRVILVVKDTDSASGGETHHGSVYSGTLTTLFKGAGLSKATLELKRGENDRVVSTFAAELKDAEEIYILPSTP